VAHACNPSYTGGTDQEDQSLKPAQTRPYLTKKKKKLHKKKRKNRAGGVVQGESPEFKLQYCKKKKKYKP
jgi:hypothetical protein